MKILYFVRGNPTADQSEKAKDMGAFVRNADACHSGDFVEKCDAVAGDVPEQYAELPRAENTAGTTGKGKRDAATAKDKA